MRDIFLGSQILKHYCNFVYASWWNCCRMEMHLMAVNCMHSGVSTIAQKLHSVTSDSALWNRQLLIITNKYTKTTDPYYMLGFQVKFSSDKMLAFFFNQCCMERSFLQTLWYARCWAIQGIIKVCNKLSYTEIQLYQKCHAQNDKIFCTDLIEKLKKWLWNFETTRTHMWMLCLKRYANNLMGWVLFDPHTDNGQVWSEEKHKNVPLYQHKADDKPSKKLIQADARACRHPLVLIECIG